MQHVTRGHVSPHTAMVFRAVCLLSISAVLLLVSHAQAVILHTGASEPANTPADNVIGRWRTNASCVAIGRADWDTTGYILTTRHQGGGVGSSVWFGGVEYIVAEVLDTSVPTEMWSGTAYPIDMRVCRLVNTAANGGGKANLTDFALWNTDTGETGETIVIGGYGKGAGPEVGLGYYSWVGSSNTTLRWGQNTVDGTTTNPYTSSGTVRYVSKTLRFDFDGPASGDAVVAEWDSGGGVFYQDGGDWVVAGLSAYVTTVNKSYYSPSDTNWAVRVSSYAYWINNLLGEHYEPSIPGDANLDNYVDDDDLSLLLANWNTTVKATWKMGDFDYDTDVDDGDLSLLLAHWSQGTPPAAMGVVPEPATLGLLAVGGLAILRRRNR